MQQGSGRDSMERVLIRIDDVTLPHNPIPLYEPDQERTQQMKGFEPPQGLRYLGWGQVYPKHFASQVQVSLQLGDPSRSHDLRCKYEGAAGLPLSAILLALGFLVIDCMVLQVNGGADGGPGSVMQGADCFRGCQLVWGALNRFATLQADLLHEKTLKSSADAGTTTKNVFLASMTKEIRTPINGETTTHPLESDS